MICPLKAWQKGANRTTEQQHDMFNDPQVILTIHWTVLGLQVYLFLPDLGVQCPTSLLTTFFAYTPRLQGILLCSVMQALGA